MTKNQQTRLWRVVLMMVTLAISMVLIISALSQNIHVFYTPTQVLAGDVPKARRFRVGGLVLNKRVRHDADKLAYTFCVSDGQTAVTIHYAGVLPDLFREGKGVVVRGMLDRDGTIVADQVLAKHDENYMPPELVDSYHVATKPHVVK